MLTCHTNDMILLENDDHNVANTLGALIRHKEVTGRK